MFALLLHIYLAAHDVSPKVERVSCGELAVRIVSELYGRPYQREETLKELALDSDGNTSLARIAKTLESSGFSCRIVRGSLDDLSRINGAAVVHLTKPLDDAGHFSVVTRDITTGRLVALDPIFSSSPIDIKKARLDQVWDGYCILVEDPRQSSVSAATLWLQYTLLASLICMILVSVILSAGLIQWRSSSGA